MRHLTDAFAVGALRRGRTTEQFLGACHADGLAGVAWVEVRPVVGGYEVFIHEVVDIGEIADLYEFPPLAEHDEEYFGQVVGRADDELGAFALAARYGAAAGRWVNQGVVVDEYHDFVKARRRAHGPAADQ